MTPNPKHWSEPGHRGPIAIVALVGRVPETGPLREAMRFLTTFALGCLPFLGSLEAAEPWSETWTKPAPGDGAGQIRVIPATDALVTQAAATGDTIGRLLKAARATIGVPYRWGGAQLEKEIDCSNYTWQLYRKIGLPYDRFLSTLQLATLKRSNGLYKIPFDEAEAGDLLVYGYRGTDKRWRGHVVILVDRDGRSTGHKGLVLGAHGGSVGEVQFVTFAGFEAGYFKDPRMRLCNVLRLDGSEEGSRVWHP